MPHPDLPEEQKYVDHAYDCLLKKIELRKTQQGIGLAAHPRQQHALNRALEANVDALDPTGQQFYGRIDDGTGETLYVGRYYLEDPEDREVLSISWKSDAAQPFFQADAEEPMGLVLRRRFVSDDDNVLHELYDEWFDELAQQLAEGTYSLPDPPVLGQDALLVDLESRRTGAMREIVATIQAEQDRAIRAPMDGVFVIQGGPGTGKSAVGLHRAAVLLYQHEELRDDGVLVVGPNPAFMKYIARVLPSLGEAEVRQESITRLGPAMVPSREESPKVERVKGDARMARVLANALWGRVRPAEQSLALPGARVTISEQDVRALVETAQTRSTFDAARTAFIERFVYLIAERYREAQPGSSNELANNLELLRQHEEVARALDRVWSTVTSREALRDLLTSRGRIAAAADGILDSEEQALLFRDRARTLNDERWSHADLPLLDELEHLHRAQTVTYAHVIVDEAQDLSPMQLRMIARRSPRNSFTLLGDLAQTTGHWTDRTWDDIAAQLAPDAPMRIYELSIGYRVPAEVMEYAARLVPFIAPELAEPRSVRTWEEPLFEHVEPEDVLTASLLACLTLVEKGRRVALLVPNDLAEETAAALRVGGVEFGDARKEELDQTLTLVPARLAKGLEFEATVVVEPAAIKASGDDGLRVLYVALTRTTGDLIVVHGDRLPPELQETTAGTPAPVLQSARPRVPDYVPNDAERALIDELVPDEHSIPAELADLTARIKTLSSNDRELLAAIVRWMQGRRPDAGQ